MSTWTHVAGCIRVDCLSFETTKEKRKKTAREVIKIVRENIPSGSEGPLYTDIHINPYLSHLAAFVVTIWGDLRDYDNIEEIENWFNSVCSQLWIRQAVLTIECENGQSKTITYKEKEDGE